MASAFQELCNSLVQLRLVTQSQLDECLRYSAHHIDSLLDNLVRRNHLTGYQAAQIRKGEIANLVVDDYVLLYRNASGSFARVFRARSLRDGSMVGIKVLRKRWAQDPKALASFRREAQLGMTLSHENIVPIYEVGQSLDQYYFVMEFVEGGNLREFLDIRKKLSPREATKCVLEMMQGLSYALSRGLTHRDLKMTNVLMSSTGTAKLVDFGLAGVDHGGSDYGESEQRALEYATLEKGTAVPRNDPRSDLFFVGAIYYELLTGVPAWSRTRDRLERSRLTRYSDVKPITELEPTLPRNVVAIVQKLMQVSPGERYQKAIDVVVDLRNALADVEGDGQEPARAAPRPAAPAPSLPVIMCIESRIKNQDILRTYLSKRGYRVLMLSDLQRALARVQENPPSCIVLMCEPLAADEVQRCFDAVAQSPAALVVVLGEKQQSLAAQLPASERVQVMLQPITLRALHQTMRRVLGMAAQTVEEAATDAEEETQPDAEARPRPPESLDPPA